MEVNQDQLEEHQLKKKKNTSKAYVLTGSINNTSIILEVVSRNMLKCFINFVNMLLDLQNLNY